MTLNLLREFPLLGHAITVVDDLLRDSFLPAWLTGFVEFVGLMLVLYWSVRGLLRSGLPSLSRYIEPAVSAIGVACRFFLLPESAVIRMLRRSGRTPNALIGSYSAAVLSVAALLESGLRWSMPRLRRTRTWSNWVAVLLAFGIFLLWNSAYCGVGDTECVRPFTQWASTF